MATTRDPGALSPAGRAAALALCLAIRRALEPFRADPACAPFFAARDRLAAEAAARHTAGRHAAD